MNGQQQKGEAEAFDLTRFSLTEMIRCGMALRGCGMASTQEAVCSAMADQLRASLMGPDGDQACPLVRVYLTIPFDELPPDDRSWAQQMTEPELEGSVNCMTLMGTSGIESGWNDRKMSKGHRAIPLLSQQMVLRLPMISKLIEDLGVEIEAVIAPADAEEGPEKGEVDQKAYNVFYVPEAKDATSIPDQEFVGRYGIRSVLGFGGLLPGRRLFAVILFSRIWIDPDVATHFKTIALNAKLALLSPKPTFGQVRG